jgi:hypothetical protein
MIETSLQQSEPVALPGRPSGRVARSIAAHALLTVLMVITSMLVFVPAALLHCGIRNGRRAAWITAAIVLAVTALYVAVLPVATVDDGGHAWSNVAALAFVLLLPSLAALPLVQRAEKFGRVLLFLLTGSALGMAVTEIGSRLLVNYSPFATQVAMAKASNTKIVEFYRSNGAPADALQTMSRWLDYSMIVLPGVMLIALSVMFILSLLMLGRLQAWREVAATRGGGEAGGVYLFRNLSLPDWVLFAFIIGGLTPIATGLLQKVAANTLAVVAFLYLLQGLAIFRSLLLAMGGGFAGKTLGWLLLVFLMLTGVAPLLLGVAGLFDTFFDFRHFKKRKDDSHESHSD